MFKKRIITDSEEETIRIGKILGKNVSCGDIISMEGDLGSGKTTLTKGIALGVGVSRYVKVTSPSFSLMNIYEGHMPIYHFDLYRISGIADLEELGLEEFLFADGVSVLEWGEKARCLLPKMHTRISLSSRGRRTREITIAAPRRELLKGITLGNR